MQDSEYLGELGGLSAHRQLMMLDPRGTGGSATPADPSSYRCDRLVDDVEALREHLALEHMDLLAHSAGANLALLYAARHPQPSRSSTADGMPRRKVTRLPRKATRTARPPPPSAPTARTTRPPPALSSARSLRRSCSSPARWI
jgi:pimeloyl-ACP methyl ester carboxylesterase